MNIKYCIGDYFKVQMFQVHLEIYENNSHQSEIHNFDTIVALSCDEFSFGYFRIDLNIFCWNWKYYFRFLKSIICDLQLTSGGKLPEMSLWIWKIKYLSTWFVTQNRNNVIWQWNLGRFAFQESLLHRCFSRYVRAK